MPPPSSAPSDDSELASRIRAGELAAFEIVFRTYYDELRRFAYGYVKSADIADDVVQDVMLAVWERHAEFAVRTSVPAYLYRAVRNRALDRLDHDAVVRRHADETRDDANSPSPADELLFANELARAVHQKIEALPPRLREVYRLRRESRLSNAEIADLLGISVHAVYVQMGRALKALHHALAPWVD